ncbi:MAG: type VI secretion system tube protein Hcp [Spirochaetaceae bacterium]|jgi:type VI secretion system Hcp family effector|nr:type VI secretion system tube protein Hcp [Spirochaetaceae bacterium]
MAETAGFSIVLDGIDGPEEDKAIICLSFEHGATQNISLTNDDISGTGHLVPFTFKHKVDVATPTIQQFCMQGKAISKASFEYAVNRDGDVVDVLLVDMEGVHIAKAEVSTILKDPDDPTSAHAVEEVQLVCDRITWTGEGNITKSFPE